MSSKHNELLDETVNGADYRGGQEGQRTGKILSSTHHPYQVHVKGDGNDYLALWNDFRQGRLGEVTTIKQDCKRDVHIVAAMGRQFIIKVDRQIPKLFKNRLKLILGSPKHSRIMRRVNRAVRQGCMVTPDIFLVAEKMEKRLCRETYIIQEYLAGQPLWEFTHNEVDIYGYALSPEQKGEVSRTMCKLHEHRLALADINPLNILVSEDGYKVIDLSWAGFFRIGQAIDILMLRHTMKIRLPLRGLAERLAVGYLSLKYKFQDMLRGPESAKLRWRTEPLAVITATSEETKKAK